MLNTKRPSGKISIPWTQLPWLGGMGYRYRDLSSSLMCGANGDHLVLVPRGHGLVVTTSRSDEPVHRRGGPSPLSPLKKDGLNGHTLPTDELHPLVGQSMSGRNCLRVSLWVWRGCGRRSPFCPAMYFLNAGPKACVIGPPQPVAGRPWTTELWLRDGRHRARPAGAADCPRRPRTGGSTDQCPGLPGH